MKLTFRLTIILMVFIIGLVLALVVENISSDYERTLAESERRLVSQAELLAAHDARSFEAVEILLRHTVNLAEEGLKAGQRLGTGLYVHLKSLADLIPQTRFVAVVDTKGAVVEANQRTFIGLKLGDRQYFRALASRADLNLYFGSPLVSRGPKSLFVPMARRINGPDGKFSGIIMAAVFGPYFQKFYKVLKEKEGIETALIVAGKAIFAASSGFRRKTAGTTETKAVSSINLIPLMARADSGVFRAKLFDGDAERIGALKKVPGFPAQVLMTVTTASVLSGVWQRAVILLGLVGGASVVIVLVTWGLVRQSHMRDVAEADAHKNEQRFRDVAETSSDWFWEMGPDLRYTWVSPRVEEVLLNSVDHYIGKTLEETGLRDEDFHHWKEYSEAVNARRPFRELKFQRLAQDGTNHHYVINGLPLFGPDGDFQGYRGSGRDITAEVEARDNVAQTEARFLNAIDNLREGVALFDAEEKLIFCNKSYRPSGEEMKNILVPGVSFEEFLHTRIKFQRGPEEAQGQEEEWIQRRIEHFRRGEGTFETRYGDQWFQIRDEKLSDGCTITIASDVTEIRRSEDALRQAQKMEAVGQLTGGIAHDFNNLLAIILGNAELLKERVGDDGALAENVIDAATSGAELTHQLLAFSRRQPLKPAVIDLNTLIVAMARLIGRTLGETIRIETRAAADLWNVEADPSQVENVLLNLAINARDAMPNGGNLVIETANVTLEDDRDTHLYGAPGQYSMLAVTDTGIGMPPEVLKHVFEPFFTTKEVGKGSGLGLSMVYGFAKQSGGYVTIDSEEGVYTTVKLHLPRAKGRDLSVAQEAEDGEPVARGETVLLVEDEVGVRTLAATLLGKLGYAVIEASDGGSAVAALESASRVDLLLTDVVLPGAMSGPKIAEHARRRHTGISVLFMSGYPAEVLDRLAFLDDGVEVLNKPFRRKELANKLRNALDGKRNDI